MHVDDIGALVAEAEVDEAEALLESGDTAAALAKLADALAQDPANDEARADYARLLIATGALCGGEGSGSLGAGPPEAQPTASPSNTDGLRTGAHSA